MTFANTYLSKLLTILVLTSSFSSAIGQDSLSKKLSFVHQWILVVNYTADQAFSADTLNFVRYIENANNPEFTFYRSGWFKSTFGIQSDTGGSPGVLNAVTCNEQRVGKWKMENQEIEISIEDDKWSNKMAFTVSYSIVKLTRETLILKRKIE